MGHGVSQETKGGVIRLPLGDRAVDMEEVA